MNQFKVTYLLENSDSFRNSGSNRQFQVDKDKFVLRLINYCYCYVGD